MRPAVTDNTRSLAKPQLMEKTKELSANLKSLSASDLQKMMHISEKLSRATMELASNWTDKPGSQRPAIDSFLGDIYSGLQVQGWSPADRLYANAHLRILSGLYGVLKPLDGIFPYRLEMGYKLANQQVKNLYDFWGPSIADTLPRDTLIVDLSAVEYSKTITKYIDPQHVISPKFLTISPKTGEPVFIVVHAKIARGAFASWMIRNRIDTVEKLKDFNEIGYKYDLALSTPQVPVFICKKFGGIGLSVRLL